MHQGKAILLAVLALQSCAEQLGKGKACVGGGVSGPAEGWAGARGGNVGLAVG